MHVNRISCEMARPYVGDNFADWDVEKLRIAGLARALVVQRTRVLENAGHKERSKERSHERSKERS